MLISLDCRATRCCPEVREYERSSDCSGDLIGGHGRAYGLTSTFMYTTSQRRVTPEGFVCDSLFYTSLLEYPRAVRALAAEHERKRCKPANSIMDTKFRAPRACLT
jgi:hypothetical protein